MFATLLVIAIAAAGTLWARGELARREQARDDAYQAALRRLIERDPQNTGAHEALGDALRAAGNFAEAETAYHAALEAGAGRPDDGSARAKLRGLDRDKHARLETRQPLRSPQNELYFCRRCGAANPPDARACEACGETIAYDSFFDALRDPGVRQATWESVVMLCVVLLCFQVFSFLPLLAQGSVVIAALCVIAWRLLRAIEGRRG